MRIQGMSRRSARMKSRKLLRLWNTMPAGRERELAFRDLYPLMRRGWKLTALRIPALDRELGLGVFPKP